MINLFLLQQSSKIFALFYRVLCLLMLQAHEKSCLWNINQPKKVTNICQNSSIFLVLAKYLTWRQRLRNAVFCTIPLSAIILQSQSWYNICRGLPIDLYHGAWGQNTRLKIIWNYSRRGTRYSQRRGVVEFGFENFPLKSLI